MTNNGILPHERKLLQNRFEQLVDEQRGVADLLHEAMDQSSETWHDNAPAEAASLESKRVTMLAKSVIELLEKQDIAYPEHDSDRVAIGSLVLISLLGDEVGVVIAGAPMVYDEEYLTEKLSKVSEVIVVSTEAPLGSRLLDTAAGQEGFYVTSDEREHHFQVLEVDNGSIEAIYESFV